MTVDVEQRFSRTEAIVFNLAERQATTQQQVEANTTAIGELRESVGELRESVEGLRVSVSKLREGQALLTQMFSQQQEQLVEFRHTTNATLDRIDRTLEELRHDREQ